MVISGQNLKIKIPTYIIKNYIYTGAKKDGYFFENSKKIVYPLCDLKI
jgi:hypothetical protein